MGKKVKVSEKKVEYFARVEKLLTTYEKAFIVCGDNVGSSQLQQIRKSTRSNAVILFGKNTLIKKAIRGLIPANPHFEKLLPALKGNVGFVFTNGDLAEVRAVIMKNKVPAAAKAGAFAQCAVNVPAGNTGLEPGQTSFFQALNIPTRINKGTIEIINDVKLIKEDEKVGPSEAALLQKLNIKPFHYGLQIRTIYDRGTTYGPEILDITKADLVEFFRAGLRNVASIGLATGIPNKASMPHVMANAIKNVFAVSLATEYEVPQMAKMREYLKDPSKFATASAPTAAPVATKAAAPVAKAPEPEPEQDYGMGGLFD